jgi:hypothetical protein
MTRGKRGSAGLSLGTVLLGMVVMTVVLFAAASAAVSHLNLVKSSASYEHARNLADAALSQTLARMVESDFEFGKNGGRVEVTFPDLPGASGVVTFVTSEAGFGDAFSTYNLDSDSEKVGAGGRRVPPRTVHMVARGRAGGVESWMECVYFRPPFPDGLASTGWINAKSVDLSAVRRTGDYAGGELSGIPRDNRLPANVFSNFQGTPEGGGAGGLPLGAVTISGGSRITGNVGSMGSVRISEDSVVLGEVLPNSERRDVPDLRLDEKIDLVEHTSNPIVYAGGDLQLERNWFSRSDGSLVVTGDLDLNGSVLLVKNGDLKVRGGIQGTGVILCEGDVEIHDGRTDLRSTEQVAVGCKGDFLLRAEAPAGNYFHGLVYSEGAIEAKDITVVGAMVSNGKNGRPGSVHLDNVRFVYSPTSMEITVFPLIKAHRYIDHSGDDTYHQAAFWLSMRPNGDYSKWLVSAEACLQRQDVSKTVSLARLATDVTQWRAFSPATYVSRTWTDVELPRDPNAPLTEQTIVLRDFTQQQIVPWLNQVDNLEGSLHLEWFSPLSGPPTSGEHGVPNDDDVSPYNIRGASYRFNKANSSQDASSTLRFNLNNLMAEISTHSPRVLLWRPFPR